MKNSKKKNTKNGSAYFVAAMYVGVFIFAMTLALLVYGPELDSAADQSVLGTQSSLSSSQGEAFGEINIVDKQNGYAEIVVTVDRQISPVGFDVCIEKSENFDVQEVVCSDPFSCMSSKISDNSVRIEGFMPLESVDSKSNGDIVLATIFYNPIESGSVIIDNSIDSTCKSSFYIVGFENSILPDGVEEFNLNLNQ